LTYIFHAVRLLLGLGWLLSGLMHFLAPSLQPMGHTAAAHDFTVALMQSGLFDWIKAIEIGLGLALIANRAMPLAIVALIPINLVIAYWNLVLEGGVIGWIGGALTILPTAVVVWPWRRYFWPLFILKGEADYSLAPFPRASGLPR